MRGNNNDVDGGKSAKLTNTTNSSGAPVQFGFRYTAADQEMVEITTYTDDDDGGKGLLFLSMVLPHSCFISLQLQFPLPPRSA